MSTDLRGIHQSNFFENQIMMSVFVSDQSRYRVLSNTLPWPELAEVANHFRSQKVSIHNGRPLNMRLHLGAHIAQGMNGWTDRQTEEMVRYHAGVRVLCGLAESTDSTDRTSIEGFRTQVGPLGVEALNQIIVRHAMGAGFTGTDLCAADTTVQESPIAYPTEVGHMKNISEKLLGIGRKLKAKTLAGLTALHKKTKDIFTEIRLFTRGKSEKVLEKKKQLSQELHTTVKKMMQLTKENLTDLSGRAQVQAQEKVKFYNHILGQIKQWLQTGKHPKEKIVSLWEKSARAISKGKVGKSCEFGRRWIITRLQGGYVLGNPCQKLGSDADTSIADEVVMSFLNTFGEVPNTFVYDRGGHSERNDTFLQNVGVEHNCIFPKGKKKMNVSQDIFNAVKSERSLNEASIATIKHQKYNFTKPRAKSTQTCEMKGQFAIMGFNINHLVGDIMQLWEIKLEIT